MKKTKLNINLDYIRVIVLLAVAVSITFNSLMALITTGIVYVMVEFTLGFTMLIQIHQTLMWMITPKPEPKKEAPIFELNNGVKK